MPTKRIFNPTEGYGALRSTWASSSDTSGCRIAVQSWKHRVSVGVSTDGMIANFDVSPVVARALAAELLAAADASDVAELDDAVE